MIENERGLAHRPAFNTLIREITASLVGARGEELDVAVDYCLEQTRLHFDVESISMGGITKLGELTPSLRVCGNLPERSSALSMTPPPGTEMVAQFARKGEFIYSRLEDLDGFPQFQEHTKAMGVEAAVFWAHRDMGSHVDGMAISSQNPKVWPVDTLVRLRVIGEVLFNAMYRRRAELEAERLHMFNSLASEIASKFVHLQPEQVDGEIDKALGQICECIDADMITTLQWTDMKRMSFEVSHEWHASSIEVPHQRGTIIPEDSWLTARLRTAEPIIISAPDDFPPEAVSVREACSQLGLWSILWAPFSTPHGLQGYLALGTVNRPGSWSEDIISQLSLVGNVFAKALEHRTADLELQNAYSEIRKLKSHIEAENMTLREEIKASFKENELIGRSHAFRTTLHQMEQVGPTDSTVLILGETGTGKGLIARRIHNLSGRKNRSLIIVNCAALPAALIESELFGHEKGAFTGAISRKIGRFELADGGTILLDEVGDLPLDLQAKLLRVLQDHEFERLGSTTTRTVDTRVMAATNRDLDKLILQGAFRADLYYRLGVFPIRIPSLRERRDDIPMLVWFFITDLQARLGKKLETVPKQTMDALISYNWPGNVRELRNVIEHAMILSPGTRLELKGILPVIRDGSGAPELTGGGPDASLEDVERTHIISVLEDCRWKVRGEEGAAERLGLKRSTLQSRMKKLGIQRPTN